MNRLSSFSSKTLTTLAILAAVLGSTTVCAAAQRGAGSFSRSVGARSGGGFVSYGPRYWGGYGGYAPYYGSAYAGPAGPYLPDGWWTGYYGNTDPRGPAYNPDSGYAWDSVTTLVLETLPAKARVTLDGIFVGSADLLGPFQLPSGQHTLRIEAAGYEPSETVLKVEQPAVQQLTVKLNEASHSSKPAPRR
jgi:hypothetical protein